MYVSVYLSHTYVFWAESYLLVYVECTRSNDQNVVAIQQETNTHVIRKTSVCTS